MRGVALRGNNVSFGDYGLQSLKSGWVTARQIEAGRIAASHFLRREGRVFIRIFPHKPVSGKPLETRMGKGKGEPEYWVAIVKPGTVMFEITGVDEPTAKRALARVAHKMPVPCRFVARKGAAA
jgi:large subunit ribosomal protein L16